MGWLVQVSLTLFAFTGSTRLVEGVNAKSATCTSQPKDSSMAKLDLNGAQKHTPLTNQLHWVAVEGETASVVAPVATCGDCPHTYELYPAFLSSPVALCHPQPIAKQKCKKLLY